MRRKPSHIKHGRTSNQNALVCARQIALEEMDLEVKSLFKVALTTLEQIPSAKREYHRDHGNDADDRSIRFVNSSYQEAFRLPDGGIIQIRFPDRIQQERCIYIDDKHCRLGKELYHLYYLAEEVEYLHAKLEPKPEIMSDKAAWKIGEEKYLTVCAAEDGWDYAFYDDQYKLVDKGQLKHSTMSIQEIREMILQVNYLENRSREPVDYELIKEKVAEKEKGQLFDGSEKQTLTVLRVEPGKEPYVKIIEDGYRSLQSEVDGIFQLIYPFEEPVALICNDESKLLGMPLNRALKGREEHL